MTDDWYAACLDEVEDFLQLFESTDEATVRIDDDLVAALVGVLTGAYISLAAAQRASESLAGFRLLQASPKSS